jgi:UPF0755 protein
LAEGRSPFVIDEDHQGPDPHLLLFGSDADQDPSPLATAEYGRRYGEPRAPRNRSRTRHGRRTRRRHRRTLTVVVVLVLVVLGLCGWFIARPLIEGQLHPKDYSGPGTGSVLVQVQQGDGTGDIARSLVDSGVVASQRAFLSAASADSRSAFIQPGTYQLHAHMAAKLALAAMLAPSSRVALHMTIPEGSTVFDVEARLAQALKVPKATVVAAATNVADLGLPVSYTTTDNSPPTSAEGFLFPTTYDFDPGTQPLDALQQMTGEFTNTDHSLGFAEAAGTLGLTPYQALIIASMVEKEAKFDEDRAKVARVILNRTAANMPLQIDATSIYGAILTGQDPTKVTFTENSPYNTRIRKGYPPTPISNPGKESLEAAMHPATGDWLYYVQSDSAGHMFFTSNYNAFLAASKVCAQRHWGCG